MRWHHAASSQHKGHALRQQLDNQIALILTDVKREIGF